MWGDLELWVDNREGVYTSLVLCKSYGSIALVFKPEVLGRRDFTGYAVDHVGTYVMDQDILRTPSSHKEILQKYTLAPEEYFDFFAYATASFMSHTIWDYTHETDDNENDERKRTLEAICCDITLPIVRPEDIASIIIDTDHIEAEYKENLDGIVANVKARGIPITTINGMSPSRNHPGHMENTTSEQILTIFAREHGLLPKIIRAIMNVA